MIRTPSHVRGLDRETHVTLTSEFERVGKQVFQYLLQTLRVGVDGPAQVSIESHFKCQATSFGLVPERSRNRFEETVKGDLLGIDRYRSRFNLRKIENVADEIQEICAGAVDRARKLDLLVRQIVVGIVAELLAKDQDAVQRRSEFVRHVREELGFVAGRQRQLGGFFFHRATGLIDFFVLALDFDISLGQLLSLLRQLFVGLLHRLLLVLKLGGEFLRLRKQAFGLHRRFDTVQDDTDADGQLFKEGKVCRFELVQGA